MDPDPEPDPANLTKSGPEPDPAKILDPVDLYLGGSFFLPGTSS